MLTGNFAFAQKLLPNSAKIQMQLEQLNVVGNVLYLAAHPDDENTRLISWLANEKKVRTAYLSLTRGDGGQNLIGNEKGPLMGLIRTQELLEARKLDGGEQFFTRALDFGYSKTADETLEKWKRDSILSDVVRIIRKYKPDVIITRFPPDKRAGHGHHTTSAMLAEEAFDAANDPNKFPESARLYGTWNTQRLYFNNSPWWDKTIEERKDKFVTVNIGAYNPFLGKSYSELASESRSRHQSQGFGSLRSRGNRIEYLELSKGSKAEKDIFEGIDLTWNRISSIPQKDKENIIQLIETIHAEYSPFHPEKSVVKLTELYALMKEHKGNVWVDQKLKETKNLIVACSGLWLEFTSDKANYTPNENIKVSAQVIPQLDLPKSIYVSNVSINGKTTDIKQQNTGVSKMVKDTLKAPSITQPYWLEESSQHDMFTIKNRNNIGKPENDPLFVASYTLTTPYGSIAFERPLVYKWRDRVDGELYRNVNVIPPVTVHFEEKAFLFRNKNAQNVNIKVSIHQDHNQLAVSPNLPKGWKANPNKIDLTDLKQGDVQFLTFSVTPEKSAESGSMGITMNGDGTSWNKDLIEIEYPHIQTQVVLPIAESQLIRYDIETIGQKIGYIMGAGDEIPKALEQLGYTVDLIDIQQTGLNQLKNYDAIVLGIRALNTKKELIGLQSALLEYVKQGGHMVVQYTTNYGLLTKDFAPFPMEIGRDRVTKEEAKPTFLHPDHALFAKPNKISALDFDNWVQERGLYFAKTWDENYTSLIGWNDPGETQKDGALLVTEYGKGSFIFTGISFFRQLPAGVPGAYRLFANIVSYRSTKKPQ